MGFRFLGPGRSVFIEKRFYFDFSLMLSRKTFLPVIRRASFGRSSVLHPKREQTNLLDIPFWNSAFKPNRRKYLSKISSRFKIFFFAFGTKDLNSLEEISEIFVKNVISTWNYTSGGPQSCKFLSHLCVNSMYSFIVWSIFFHFPYRTGSILVRSQIEYRSLI